MYQHILYSGICNIKYALLSALGMQLALYLHYHFRMAAVQLAVNIHHFRLYPDAESHSHCFYFTGKGFKSAGELALVRLPVAE